MITWSQWYKIQLTNLREYQTSDMSPFYKSLQSSSSITYYLLIFSNALSSKWLDSDSQETSAIDRRKYKKWSTHLIKEFTLNELSANISQSVIHTLHLPEHRDFNFLPPRSKHRDGGAMTSNCSAIDSPNLRRETTKCKWICSRSSSYSSIFHWLDSILECPFVVPSACRKVQGY